MRDCFIITTDLRKWVIGKNCSACTFFGHILDTILIEKIGAKVSQFIENLARGSFKKMRGAVRAFGVRNEQSAWYLVEKCVPGPAKLFCLALPGCSYAKFAKDFSPP